ncbi:MAG: hypothetical protein RLO50_12275 [Azospirillaceae bacterium]
MLNEAMVGAADDGSAEIGLTQAVALERGFRQLDAEEARRAVSGNTLTLNWRSGRIVQHSYHRPSGLRLDSLRFTALGFTNGVTVAWYIDSDGAYCETDASRRNCGPLFGDGASLIWFNRQQPEGPYGTPLDVATGNQVDALDGPIGPLMPQPVITVASSGGSRQGLANVFRLRIRNQPEQLAAAHEVPHPTAPDLLCVALRHPTREPELRCPDGLGAVGREPAGWPTDSGPALMQSGTGAPASIRVDRIDPAIVPADMPFSNLGA